MTKAGRDAALDEQMDQCRELLREVRGATKDSAVAARDLRAAVAEAKNAIPEVARAHVAELIERQTVPEIVKMTVRIRDQIDIAEAKILGRFEKLVKAMADGVHRNTVTPDQAVALLLEALAPLGELRKSGERK